MKKLIVSALAAMITAGCAGVTYTDQSLADRVGYTTDETAKDYAPDNEWWKGYNDRELNRLVDMAFANNMDYGKSAINISLALYQANLAGLDLYPTLTGSLGATAGKDLTIGDDFTKSFSGELALSYELDLLGRTRDAADARELEYKATILDRETERLVLVNSVVDAYFNLAYLYGSLASAQDTLKNYRQIYDIVNSKYTFGKSDSSEFLQARQSVISAENSIIDLNNQIKSAEQTLRNLLNISPTDKLELHYADLLDVKPLGVDLDVPLSVLAERPDLKASELRLQESFKNVEEQNKGWYPTITLSAAVNSSSDSVGTMFNFPFLTGGLRISLPFLSWNTVRYNIKISEAQYESALLDFEGTINTALNEVAYYYYAYRFSKDMLGKSREQYDTTRKLTSYYNYNYTSGKTELSDLLNSMNNENNSKKDMLNNSYQLIKYENMVYKSMAGRYEPVPGTATEPVSSFSPSPLP